MTKPINTKTVKRASRKKLPIFDSEIFYPIPQTAGEAALADLEEARRDEGGAVLERLAQALGIKEKSVYALKRQSTVWTPELLAHVAATAGRGHLLAFLRLASASPAAAPRDHFAVLEAIGRIAHQASALNLATAQSLAPDNRTPGVIDAKEKRALTALTEALLAAAEAALLTILLA